MAGSAPGGAGDGSPPRPSRARSASGTAATNASGGRRSSPRVRRRAVAGRAASSPGVNPPAPPGADPAIESLLAFRRGALLQCYETPRAEARARAEVHAVLFVDGDGRAADVRVASAPADAPLEACVREAIEAWEFPASDGGYSGPFLVRQAFDAAPGPTPGFAVPGGLRPALRDPGCVERGLRVPAELRGGVGEIAVKLAVDAAGRPALVHALSPAPEPLVDAVAAAVRACPWSAGGDAEGRPVPLWTTLTVRLAGR